MNVNEFQAWFEGFTEGMDGIPAPHQWETIKGRVKAISRDETSLSKFLEYEVLPRKRWFDERYGLRPALAVASVTAPTREDWVAVGSAEFRQSGGVSVFVR